MVKAQDMIAHIFAAIIMANRAGAVAATLANQGRERLRAGDEDGARALGAAAETLLRADRETNEEYAREVNALARGD